jgi:hypothetical protein
MMFRFRSAAVLSLALAAPAAAAQHQHAPAHEQLGTVDFATSCSAEAVMGLTSTAS